MSIFRVIVDQLTIGGVFNQDDRYPGLKKSDLSCRYRSDDQIETMLSQLCGNHVCVPLCNKQAVMIGIAPVQQKACATMEVARNNLFFARNRADPGDFAAVFLQRPSHVRERASP